MHVAMHESMLLVKLQLVKKTLASIQICTYWTHCFLGISTTVDPWTYNLSLDQLYQFQWFIPVLMNGFKNIFNSKVRFPRWWIKSSVNGRSCFSAKTESSHSQHTDFQAQLVTGLLSKVKTLTNYNLYAKDFQISTDPRKALYEGKKYYIYTVQWALAPQSWCPHLFFWLKKANCWQDVFKIALIILHT